MVSSTFGWTNYGLCGRPGRRELSTFIFLHFSSDFDPPMFEPHKLGRSSNMLPLTPLRSSLAGIPTYFYAADVSAGVQTDDVTGAFLTNGYTDAHSGLDYESRYTCDGQLNSQPIIDLIFGKSISFQIPSFAMMSRVGV